MEDRHTISEPRIKSPNSLVWIIDIYRDGVHEPVDTIEISEDNLPPRKRKGKVVWRLPLDHSRLPSFPLDERRRILELFKERKKNRRKERKSVTSIIGGGGGGTDAVSSSLGDDMDPDADADAIGVADASGVAVAETATSSTHGIDDDVSPNPTAPAVESSTNSSSSSSTNSSICSRRSGKENNISHPIQNQLQPQHRVQQQQQQQRETLHGSNNLGGTVKGKVDSASSNDAVSTSKDGTTMPFEANTSVTLSKTKTKNKNKNNKVKRPLSTNSNGVMDNHDDHESVRENAIGEETGLSSSPPLTHSEFLNNPLLQPCSSSSGNNNNNNNTNNRSEPFPSLTSTPPPGFHNISMNILTLEESGESDIATGMSQDMNGEYASGFHPPAHPTMSTTQDLYIVIPPVDRPIYPTGSSLPLSCRPSLAIPAAKAFVDLYYRLLTIGQYSELSRYYTFNAQKSISVGGAHSVVATRPEIMLQLQSLSKSIFIVRGVVSQDTQDGRGAHILVTGMVQTGEVLTQFAHSVGLVVAPQQYGLFSFQIHNDALALMATGGSGGGEEEGVVARDCPDHVRGGGDAGEQGIQQHGDGQERWNRDMSTSTNGFSKSVVQDKSGVSSQNGWHQ